MVMRMFLTNGYSGLVGPTLTPSASRALGSSLQSTVGAFSRGQCLRDEVRTLLPSSPEENPGDQYLLPAILCFVRVSRAWVFTTASTSRKYGRRSRRYHFPHAKHARLFEKSICQSLTGLCPPLPPRQPICFLTERMKLPWDHLTHPPSASMPPCYRWAHGYPKASTLGRDVSFPV